MPLSSALDEGSPHDSGGQNQEEPQGNVAPPLGAAAVRIDVDVRHAYSARAGTERDTTGETVRRFRRSIA